MVKDLQQHMPVPRSGLVSVKNSRKLSQRCIKKRVIRKERKKSEQILNTHVYEYKSIDYGPQLNSPVSQLGSI